MRGFAGAFFDAALRLLLLFGVIWVGLRLFNVI